MNWKFKEDIKVYTEEFWYDLTDGGYIKPEEILVDESQAAELLKAIELVRSFERAIDELSEGEE